MPQRLLVVVFALLSSVAAAAEPPVTVKLLTNDTELGADGIPVQTVHVERRVSNDDDARGIAQRCIVFSERVETPEVLDAATVKLDGRRLPIDLGKIVTQLQPGIANMPLYNDMKRLVLVYPDVGADDTISLTWRRRIHHPVMPGALKAASTFPRLTPYEDARFTVTVPSETKLRIEAHGIRTEQDMRDGKTVYSWRYSAGSVPEDPAALLPIERVPRVFVSSLPDWDALGHLWASQVADKMTVMPPIQALADRITAGTSDRREQAKRLYDWVGTNVRWVAIYIGNGTIVPHVADEVLANRYGDCKDKVMLLAALLHAKGITAEPVLIHSGNSYSLPDVAAVYSFNHVIAYLPEWDLYADTTAGGAPFGTLADYGKPVVHAVAEGSVRHNAPVLPAGLASLSTTTTMRLSVLA